MTSGRRPYRSPTLRRYVRCSACGHYHASEPQGAPSDPRIVCGSECLNPACPECENLLRVVVDESARLDIAWVGACPIGGAILGYALTGTGWGAFAGGFIGFFVGFMARMGA